MDLFERLLHVRPDGSNGLLEFAYALLAVTALVTILKHKTVANALRHLVISLRQIT